MAEDKPIVFVIDNAFAYASTGTLATSSELTLTLTGQAGDWTLAAEAGAELTGEFISADTFTLAVPTLILAAANEKVGVFEIGDQDNALKAGCIMPRAETTHFNTEDVMTFATCRDYSGGQIVGYTSPDFNGFSFRTSAMADLKGTIDVGAVDSSWSALLGYQQEIDNGVALGASLGLDTALSVKGGGVPLPTIVHGGLSVGIDGWVLAAAGAVETASLSGGNSTAAGVGVSKLVGDNLVIGAEIATDQYEDAGVVLTETVFGASAEYVLIPDRVLIDGLANVLHRTGDGVDETVTTVGAGISVIF